MSKILIRGWSSDDGWWLGADERLQFIAKFRKYGFFAKITFLYAKTFYQKVVVEIEEDE